MSNDHLRVNTLPETDSTQSSTLCGVGPDAQGVERPRRFSCRGPAGKWDKTSLATAVVPCPCQNSEDTPYLSSMPENFNAKYKSNHADSPPRRSVNLKLILIA